MRVALATLVTLAVAGLTAFAPPAGAKEGLRAELLTALSPDQQPGTMVDVAWRLTVLDAAKRVPFNAASVFVRLLDAAGGAPTLAFARGAAHPDGLYEATVQVPGGGIGGIVIGVRGSTDLIVPIGNDPFSLNRPLQLPKLARGARCPVATSDPAILFSTVYRIGKGLGAGPVFPVFGTGATLHLAPPANFNSARWGGQKVLWFVLPSYTGPVLIRGGRLDRPGRIGFERGSIPSLELHLDSSTVQPRGGDVPAGARYRPSYTRIVAPGCYAYQVDGTTFSRTIVFRAVRGS
jgi:hypothetical protein